MNLLEFAIQAQFYLDTINDSSFAKEFVRLKTECFYKYHLYTIKNKKGEEQSDYYVTISLGLDYFKEIIKNWDNPRDFFKIHSEFELDEKGKPTKVISVYNNNFVKMLINQKQTI